MMCDIDGFSEELSILEKHNERQNDLKQKQKSKQQKHRWDFFYKTCWLEDQKHRKNNNICNM